MLCNQSSVFSLFSYKACSVSSWPTARAGTCTKGRYHTIPYHTIPNLTKPYHLSRLKKEKAKGVYIAEGVVMRWTIQIALALQYLHARNILHRDLKTQNIFLTKSDLVKVRSTLY